MLRKETKYFFILFLLISFSISIKVFFLDKNFSEIDDRISIIQILRYKNESLYSISNDKLSPNYNNQIKKKIREIENKNNKFFDFTERIISNILMRAAPSKHSTYAPMQYWLFADLINKDQSYDELKFFSRIPSVFFSILYILVTYFFCTHIFKKENKFSLSSVFILTLSFPLLYISLRSYNYAAGTFTTTFIFFLTYLEMIGKNLISLKNGVLNVDFMIMTYINI